MGYMSSLPQSDIETRLRGIMLLPFIVWTAGKIRHLVMLIIRTPLTPSRSPVASVHTPPSYIMLLVSGISIKRPRRTYMSWYACTFLSLSIVRILPKYTMTSSLLQCK